MASQLLYLGLLFTMTVAFKYAQGTEGNEEPKIDPGLSLVPGPHVVLVQPNMKTPVLLNCSLNVTDQRLLQLEYNWLKDGQPIDVMHRKSKMQLLPNGSLLLQPRKSRNRNRTLDGVYDCFVTTATGNVVIARRVKVVVASIAKNFSKEPTSKEAYKGGVARFECNIRAEPVASYIWHRDDTQLPQDDDERFTSLRSGVLQISDIDLSDAGHYWCQATTYLFTPQEQLANFGWKKGKRAELRVKSDYSARPPTLLGSPRNISVLAGDTAEFECFADGNPLPAVVWKKINSNETLGPQNVSPTGNLRLVQVTPLDAGVYECAVTGRGKTLKASATLTVLEPPKLELGPESYLYPAGKAASTSCKMSGNPPPKISWYHNGIPISETDIYVEIRDIKNGQTLILYSLQKKNSGYYQCVGENSVGHVMVVALLEIYINPEAPLPPTNVKCSPINSTAFLVTWDHGNGQHPYVVSYRIVGDTKPPTQAFCPVIPNASKQRCVIPDQLPYTNYSVRVQAYSYKGASEITDRIYVQTLEDVLVVRHDSNGTAKGYPVMIHSCASEFHTKCSSLSHVKSGTDSGPNKPAVRPVPQTVPRLSVTSPQFHSMLVSWTPLTLEESRGRVVSYRVYYRSADKRDETSKEVSGNQTSYLITGVEAKKSYEILVVAATSAGYTKRDHSPWYHYTTPPANASSPPRLEIKYINETAVWLEWKAPEASLYPAADQTITGYYLEVQSMSRSAEPLRTFDLEASVFSYIIPDLDNEYFYKVSLTALTKQGASAPSTSEFQLKELQFQLVPDNVRADSVDSTSVSLSWTAVPGINVKYEVCFRKELEKSDRLCKFSKETSLTISDLESFTRYEFIVRAIMDGVSGADSKNLIVQTTEDIPSAPLNLTVNVEQNTVLLNWLPPEKPNGVITYYVIMYGKDNEETGDVTWKSITQKGTETTAHLEDLESGHYLFKLTAGNNAGRSQDTDVVTAVAMCKTQVETSCFSVIKTTEENVDVTGATNDSGISTLTSVQIGITVGCLTALICFVLVVVVVRHFCQRSYAREEEPNTSNSPIYRVNGHVSPVPGNGHVHMVGNTPGDYRHESVNMHESTPMLGQIPENEHSDSKGGPLLNGFIPNGVVKGNHKIVNQTHHSHFSGDLKSSNNSEELQGLMAAVFASVDRNESFGNATGETIAMSSLDDIDRSGDYLGDNSSQDSGMGGRHAGMLGSKDMHPNDLSPASSPGENSLGRHHQGWEMGREVDEIGGVFIDRSTGAVIGEVSPRCKVADKEVRDEQVTRGKTVEDSTSNDRDSGHGSETRSHGGVLNLNGTGDDAKNSFGLSFDAPVSTSPPNVQSEEMVMNLLPPPPPPPPPLFMSSPAAQSSSSVSSSQQLSCSRSRNLSNSSRPQNSHRPHQRSVRQNITHTDLPPPPPSPPPLTSSPTLPPFQCSLAAVAAASATAELNSSGSSIEEGGQQQLNDGSKVSRQLEGEETVAFSSALSSPTHPHIA